MIIVEGGKPYVKAVSASYSLPVNIHGIQKT